MHFREYFEDPPHYVLFPEQECGMFTVESSDSDSENYDSDFYDSDFNVEEGDDDLFANNIDKSVNDHNEKEVCEEMEDEGALDDDDINIGEEQEQHLKKVIKPFNPEVDMDNPSFKIGMKFSGVEELRKALTTYSIRNRKQIKKTKNDRRRPFICIDGCHIKTRYKGVLLTAVGIDPNDCIYPVAFGLCEVECTSSWEWFLKNLKDDLNITNTAPWTIMSDKQNGLINVVLKVFPDAEHRFCVRHMLQNFQRAGHRGETLKNDVWAIARSTNVPKWQRNMDKLKVDSEVAFTWIEELVPNTWIKTFFSEFPKCDMLLNNHSEVFNSYILEAREMPFLSMLETIFYKILQMTETKQREAQKMTGRICPKIRKKLEKFFEWSKECGVTPEGNYLYSVRTHEMEKEYSVDFKTRTCDCRRWQLTGIPCHHAIACCRKDQINPENLVHSCYTIDTFKKSYAFNLAPLRGRAFWENMNGVTIYPPLFTKVMGRPKKNRKKAPEEKIKNGVKTFTKAGVTIHCSICGKPNHNKKGHQKYVDSLAKQMQNSIVGEDEEINILEILQHVIPHTPYPLLDPTQLQDSMMHQMQEEEKECVPINRVLGPLLENAFVVSARDNAPASRVRVTTASNRGNLRGRGRGRSSTPRQVEEGSNNFGRGKGKKRPANVEATGSGTRARAPSFIPDLNEQIPHQDAHEVPLSQNAPAADDM
ncbi:hypothetical protein ACQ4PT_020989 [Festuca glaucescens]